MFDLSGEISQIEFKQSGPDVRVENYGTFLLMYPLSGRAADWISKHFIGEPQWFGRWMVVEHPSAPDLVECMREAGLLVKVQPSVLAAGDQGPSERIRSVFFATFERHFVIKVRQRNVPYAEIAHIREGTITFRRRERIWNRWRCKLIEIDAATCMPSTFCGAPCWQITGELKKEADRILGRRAWIICAHQVEADFPC